MTDMATPIRVSYIFDFSDKQAFDRVYPTDERLRALENRQCLYVWAGGFMLSLGLLALFSIVSRPKGELIDFSVLTTGTTAIAIFVLALYFCSSVVQRAQRPVLFSLMRIANRTVTYELAPDGVTSECGAHRGHCGWTVFTRYIETPDRFFLFLSVWEAFVIPRRAFSSDADFANAITYAKERIHGQTL